MELCREGGMYCDGSCGDAPPCAGHGKVAPRSCLGGCEIIMNTAPSGVVEYSPQRYRYSRIPCGHPNRIWNPLPRGKPRGYHPVPRKAGRMYTRCRGSHALRAGGTCGCSSTTWGLVNSDGPAGLIRYLQMVDSARRLSTTFPALSCVMLNLFISRLSCACRQYGVFRQMSFCRN